MSSKRSLIKNLDYNYLLETLSFAITGKGTGEIGENVYDCLRDLIHNYSRYGRHYHTLEHIIECLQNYCLNCTSVPDPDVLLAIWYHDAVYDVSSKDNEENSVTFMYASNNEYNLGISTERLSKVGLLILASKKHMEHTSVFLDIDLAILGESSSRYARYAEDIRKEFYFVPNDIYRKERARILNNFLKEERIYKTDILPGYYEVNARKNIQEEIDRLINKELSNA